MSEGWYDHEVFDKAWNDFRQRSNRVDIVRRYFMSKSTAEKIDYKSLKKIISVGQGEGDLDDIVISLCPNLKEYVGIESHSKRCDESKIKLSTNHPSVKVHCVNSRFEDYEFEEKSCDMVLFIHSLYEMRDNLDGALRHGISLVKPGGVLVIMTNHGNYFKTLGTAVTKTYINFEVAVRKAIQGQRLSYTEEKTEDFLIDFANKGAGYFDILDLANIHEVTNREKDEILRRMQPYMLPGTSKFSYDHTVFIVRK